MRTETIEYVFRALGSFNPVPRVNSAGTWASVSCPLAPFTHGGGRDKNPSFMVNVEHGASPCKCLSCGFSGSVRQLLAEVRRYGGIDANVFEDLDFLVVLEAARHYGAVARQGLVKTLPPELLANLDTYHPYWEQRGIDRATARKWRLGYDPESRRALLPFFDLSGDLVGVVGRDITGHELKKYLVQPEGFDRANYLYGEHRLTGKESMLFLVEGMLDAVSASQYLSSEVGVVALGSALPTDAQLRRLRLLTDKELIVGLDRDDAGQRGALQVRRALSGVVKVTIVDYGAFKDANEAGADIVAIVANRRDPVLSGILEQLSGMTRSRQMSG